MSFSIFPRRHQLIAGLCATLSIAANASDGRIMFVGALVNPTCSVTPLHADAKRSAAALPAAAVEGCAAFKRSAAMSVSTDTSGTASPARSSEPGAAANLTYLVEYN